MTSMRIMILACAAQLMFHAGAHAAVISHDDEAAFLAASEAISVEDFNTQVDGTTFHSTSLDVGDFTISMTGAPSTKTGRNQIEAPSYWFSALGVDDTAVAHVLTDVGDSLVLSFDSAISAFGVALAGFNNERRIRTRILVGGSSFEPAASVGSVVRFFGVTSDAAFTSIEFQGISNDGWGMDNVMYGSAARPASPVPAPGLFSLLLLGLSALAWVRRRG